VNQRADHEEEKGGGGGGGHVESLADSLAASAPHLASEEARSKRQQAALNGYVARELNVQFTVVLILQSVHQHVALRRGVHCF
jgi:hypothetical protein